MEDADAASRAHNQVIIMSMALSEFLSMGNWVFILAFTDSIWGIICILYINFL